MIDRLCASGMGVAPATYLVAAILVSDAAVMTQTYPPGVTSRDYWPDGAEDGQLERDLGHAFNKVSRVLRKLIDRHAESDARLILNGLPRWKGGDKPTP